MKKIWARIGIVLDVTDERYAKLLKEATDEYGRIQDLTIDDRLAERFARCGFVDGDSYIPAYVFEENDTMFAKEDEE